MANSTCVIIVILCIVINALCQDISSWFDFTELIEEPSSKEELLYLMYNQTQFDTLVIEIYSPLCWHCMKFKSKYKEVANTFKDNKSIKFIKLSSFTESVWNETFTNVTGYPTLYLYNQQQLLKYEGVYEKEPVITFINKRNFKCEEIISLDQFDMFIKNNFIPQSTITSVNHYNQHKFILGIIQNTTKDIQHYNDMHIKYKNIIYNNECYYITYNNTSTINKLNQQLLLHGVIPFIILVNNTNTIFTFNHDKGINTFSFSYINDNNYDRYKLFLNENYFLLIEEYDEDYLTELFNRGKRFAVFAYKTQEEFEYLQPIIYEYIHSDEIPKYIKDQYNILSVNITKTKLIKESLIQYTMFGKYSGFYTASNDFASQKSLLLVDKEFDALDIKSVTYDKVIQLINEDMKSINTHNETNTINDESNDNSDSIDNSSNEETQIINDNIQQEEFLINNDNDDTINTKAIMLPMYIIVYTVIFIYTYKTYLYKYFDNDILPTTITNIFTHDNIKHN